MCYRIISSYPQFGRLRPLAMSKISTAAQLQLGDQFDRQTKPHGHKNGLRDAPRGD